MKTTRPRVDFAHGSTLPFDRLTALSGVEGLTVPERRAERSALSLSKGSLAPWGEGGKPVRLSAANGPERSEGAQGKLREPGEGFSRLFSKQTTFSGK